jgi:hypothetical protein
MGRTDAIQTWSMSGKVAPLQESVERSQQLQEEGKQC